MERKIMILKLIQEKKELLFGAFSSTVTKPEKVKEWHSILLKCQALGLVKEEKDYAYVRDVFWQNIKKTTLAKVDNSRKTGSAGGKVAILNPVDNLVLDIIDKRSPCVNGLNQVDCLSVGGADEGQTTIDIITHDPDKPSAEGSAPTEIPSNLGTLRVPTLKRKAKRWITKNTPAFKEHEEELAVKRKKTQLQVENLEIANYKLRVELYMLEKQACLKSSKYTQCFEEEK